MLWCLKERCEAKEAFRANKTPLVVAIEGSQTPKAVAMMPSMDALRSLKRCVHAKFSMQPHRCGPTSCSV